MNNRGFLGFIGKLIALVMILLIVAGAFYLFNLKEKYFGGNDKVAESEITGEVVEEIVDKTKNIGIEIVEKVSFDDEKGYKEVSLVDNMKLTSSSFEFGKEIPRKYSCEGSNISPPLTFSEIPEETKSLVLIMYDPDIPQIFKDRRSIEGWEHWLVWNINPSTIELGEGSIPTGSVQGKNTGGNLGYTGPCPPKEYQPTRHRYEFTIYALNVETLDLDEGATKLEVLNAMESHILDKAELVGTYEKSS